MIEKTKRSIQQWVIPISKQKYAGVHLIAEFWYGKNIENEKELKNILEGAVKAANNTPLQFAVHKFQPQGITGVVLLAESHIAFHSWPEFNYVAVDVYTCGDQSTPEKALDYLKGALKPQKTEVKKIKRGKIT